MGTTAVAVGVAAIGLGLGHWALDRGLNRVYGHWKPVLERQVSRVMGHPFHLGPYQGLGWGGLRVGATRLASGRFDRSSLSATGAAVSLDPLASLRQGFPVVQISLEGGRADLKPNRQGQWWVLGPGGGKGPPPKLELRFRLRQRAQVFLPKSPTPLGLDGRLAIQVHRRALQLQTRLIPPGPTGRAGSAGSLALNASGRWDRRAWMGQLRLDHLALAAVQRSVGGNLQANSGQWSGQANGGLEWSWQAGRPSCQGGVRLDSLGWRPSPKAQALVVPHLVALCQGQQVSIQPTPWQWESQSQRQWQGQRLKGDGSLRAHWQWGHPRGGSPRAASCWWTRSSFAWVPPGCGWRGGLAPSWIGRAAGRSIQGIFGRIRPCPLG